MKAAAATAQGKAVSKGTQKKIQKGTNWQEAERDRLRDQRAKNAAAAKAQADAEKARAERERARGERLRNAAAKIGAKVKGTLTSRCSTSNSIKSPVFINASGPPIHDSGDTCRTHVP